MKKLKTLLWGLLWCAGMALPAFAGEVLVIFRNEPGTLVTAASVENGSEALRVASLASEAGATVAASYGALSEGMGGPFVLLRAEGKTTEELTEELRDRGDVLTVCPNYEFHLAAEPNDPQYGSQWNLQTVRAPAAWDTTTGSGGVYVAMIDTGVYASHPDLADNLDTTRSRNFSSNGGSSDFNDVQGHGSHVAGIVGAKGNNGVGIAGVNWATKVIAVKAFHGATTQLSNVVNSLNYVKQLLDNEPGLNLVAVNMSFATNQIPGTPSEIASNTSHGGYAFWKALSVLSATNRVLLVVAAGNEGMEVGVPGSNGNYAYPASFNGLDNMIAVANMNQDGTLYKSSNYSGTKVHIGAPGVSILSTAPASVNSSGYQNLTGTSQAAPHVAGAAALLRSAYPSATVSQIKMAILRGAASGLAGYTAYGILDIKGALDYMASGKSEPVTDSDSKESSSSSSTTRKSSGGGGCGAGPVTAWTLLLAVLPCWRRR